MLFCEIRETNFARKSAETTTTVEYVITEPYQKLQSANNNIAFSDNSGLAHNY